MPHQTVIENNHYIQIHYYVSVFVLNNLYKKYVTDFIFSFPTVYVISRLNPLTIVALMEGPSHVSLSLVLISVLFLYMCHL